jgi:hypothetical protein
MVANGLLVGLLTLATPCLQTLQVQNPIGTLHYQGDDDSFIPFKDFLKQVERAKYEDYKYSNVRCREDFEDMRKHILRMYKGVGHVTSYVLDNDYGDCIAIKEQPTFRLLHLKKIAEPPKNLTGVPETEGPRPGNTSYADSPLKLGLKDRFGNSISCPMHTIPMARLTLEKLTRFATLSDFFAKVPQEAKVPGFLPDWDPTHLHAYGYQKVDNYGGDSWLNLWNPEGDFSISQQWYTGGTGCNLQTVEGGWIRCPSCGFSSDKSVLFIYRTNHDYNLGDCKTDTIAGCYDLDCPGFVQINNNWHLGGPWNHYSTTDGEQWGFEMQWKLYTGNWWLFLKGPGNYEAVGYYPTSIFNGGQLSKIATTIEYGGEVARKTGDSWPQMGSGAFAESGWRRAAFQKTIFWIPHDENDGFGVWANLTSVDEALAGCYTINLVDFPNDGDWGTYFFFGGPGGVLCN